MPIVAAVISSLAVSAFFLGLQIVLFRVLGHLALNTAGLNGFEGSSVYSLSEALSALPAWIVQLLNFMYLDQSVMIISSALIFAAAVRFFFGGASS